MIIVFTDGVPSDRAAAAAQIVKQANDAFPSTAELVIAAIND